MTQPSAIIPECLSNPPHKINSATADWKTNILPGIEGQRIVYSCLEGQTALEYKTSVTLKCSASEGWIVEEPVFPDILTLEEEFVCKWGRYQFLSILNLVVFEKVNTGLTQKLLYINLYMNLFSNRISNKLLS